MNKIRPEKPFAFLMEASMLGVGVGFDTEGAQKGIQIQTPVGKPETFVVPDSREGWVESMSLLLRSYLVPKQSPVLFDYSLVRPAGEPIKGFGGTAADVPRGRDQRRALLGRWLPEQPANLPVPG